mmetsp:Transcript_10401/g.27256  ORF Transcript_10401/g.27256 Transcript_10401/m.27256 type:complete len:288 (-) Transcript_10401:372-1235(-)
MIDCEICMLTYSRRPSTCAAREERRRCISFPHGLPYTCNSVIVELTARASAISLHPIAVILFHDRSIDSSVFDRAMHSAKNDAPASIIQQSRNRTSLIVRDAERGTQRCSTPPSIILFLLKSILTRVLFSRSDMARDMTPSMVNPMLDISKFFTVTLLSNAKARRRAPSLPISDNDTSTVAISGSFDSTLFSTCHTTPSGKDCAAFTMESCISFTAFKCASFASFVLSAPLLVVMAGGRPLSLLLLFSRFCGDFSSSRDRDFPPDLFFLGLELRLSLLLVRTSSDTL